MKSSRRPCRPQATRCQSAPYAPWPAYLGADTTLGSRPRPSGRRRSRETMRILTWYWKPTVCVAVPKGQKAYIWPSSNLKGVLLCQQQRNKSKDSYKKTLAALQMSIPCLKIVLKRFGRNHESRTICHSGML